MNRDPLTQTVAAVLPKDKKRPTGTAFFLGADVALTCSHVLGGRKPDQIQLIPPPAQESGPSVDFLNLEKIDVLEIDDDRDLDLALLRIAPKAYLRWLPVSRTWDLGIKVFSRGYHRPVETYPGGDPVSGTIVGSGPVSYRGLQAYLLTLEDIRPEGGLSGGPLVHHSASGTHTVLGVIRFQARDQRAHAVPTQTICARWPALVPIDESEESPQAAVFEDLLGSAGPSLAAWDAFEPSRLHCVVVESEAAVDDQLSLGKLVNRGLDSEGERIWNAFCEYWKNRSFLRGGSRQITERAGPRVETASFNVLDVFSRFANVNQAARLVVEADVGVFDVTGFEPGVMMLLGIRAAARRGVTIVSHGGGWYSGNPLPRPFNLADLSIASHTWEGRADPDPREALVATWIEEGYAQLTSQPRYLDTPVYDSVRNLGPKLEAWSPVELNSEVLVLCSYGEAFWPTWNAMRDPLSIALKAQLSHKKRPRVVRLQDLPTPQLVSQLLYEKLRRCDGCIGDWTYLSPSTFFEIGVRLAISPKSLVQIADRRWLENEETKQLKQVEAMRGIFNPLEYQVASSQGAMFDKATAERIAAQLISLTSDLESVGHPLRGVVVDAVGRTEQQRASVHEELADAADALHHAQRDVDERDARTQALFSDVTEIKADHEQSALERRLAAWLYLEHRLKAGESDNAQLRTTWRNLGKLVSAALYDVDLELALKIEQAVGEI